MPRIINIEDDVLATMWMTTMTVADIAERLGVSRGWVESHRRKLDLPPRPRGSRVGQPGRPGKKKTAADIPPQFAVRWNDGASVADLSEEFGIGPSTVANWRKLLGLPGRTLAMRGEPFADNILRLHEQGLTPKRIAVKLGTVGELAVQGVLSRRNIEPHVLRATRLTPRQPKLCPTCLNVMRPTADGFACERHGVPLPDTWAA